jgi:hypothetical protein
MNSKSSFGMTSFAHGLDSSTLSNSLANQSAHDYAKIATH